jgi:iron complex transport system ATP-binding protein
VARSIVTGAVLSAKAIHFSAAGRPILGGVDLTVAPGERVGVIGPNGSGKSTLLRCLYAWHAPTSGTVLLDGTDISALPAHRRAQAVAVLAQHTEAGLGLTVGEVVALGRLPHRRAWGRAETDDAAAIDDALALIGLEMWRDRPFGPLSGGEKQQVLFARALAQRPSLLILDEPTNHLDIRHQLELLRAARDRGVSVVVTLHDLNLAARWCDRLCLLEAGRIRATGLPDDVLTLDLIGSVYGVHVDIDRDPRTGRPRLSYYLEDRPEGPSS